jgi:hypothetical protein
MQRARPSHRVLVVDLVARPVRRPEKFSLRGIELQRQRLHGDVEVCRLRRTYDRNIAVGTTRDPGHGNVRPAYFPARGHLAHAASDLAVDLVTVEVLIDIVPRASGSRVAGEEASRERTESRDGDALIPAVGEHLPFLLAV